MENKNEEDTMLNQFIQSGKFLREKLDIKPEDIEKAIKEMRKEW